MYIPFTESLCKVWHSSFVCETDLIHLQIFCPQIKHGKAKIRGHVGQGLDFGHLSNEDVVESFP